MAKRRKAHPPEAAALVPKARVVAEAQPATASAPHPEGPRSSAAPLAAADPSSPPPSGPVPFCINKLTWFLPGLLANGWLAGGAFAAQVVEYNNTEDFPSAIGGHYFYSADAGEQAWIDAGNAGKFKRTGRSFNTGGDAPVCRFYGHPTLGPNSHFYTANMAECDWLKSIAPTKPQTVAGWNYEGQGFTVLKPDAQGTRPPTWPRAVSCPWMGAAPGATTCLSSGCGAA